MGGKGQQEIDLNLELTAKIKSQSEFNEISYPEYCQILKNSDKEVQI